MKGYKSKLFERVVGFSVKSAVERPYTIIAIACLLTILSGLAVPRIAIKSDLADLFPEHTPNVQRIKKVKAFLGYSAQLTIIIGSPSKEATMRFATDLASALERDPDIARVDFKRDISFFEKNALLLVPLHDLEELRDKIEERIQESVGKSIQLLDDEEESTDSPPKNSRKQDSEIPSVEDLKKKYGFQDISEYKMSPDGKIISITCKPKVQPTDINRSRRMLARINETISKLDPKRYDPGLEFLMEGDYHKKNDSIAQIKKDLFYSGLVAGILVLVLLFLAFRNLSAIPLVLVSLAFPIVWTFGLVWLAIGYLNLITAFIFALLMGLGIDFSIHVLSRYIEAKSEGLHVKDALEKSLSSLAGALGTAALTTTATFFSLTLFDFKGFSQFGLIAGVGVVLCLLSSLLFLPSLISVFEQAAPGLFGSFQKFENNDATSGVHKGVPFHRSLIAAGMAITAVSLVGLPMVSFEYDFDELGSPSKPQPELKKNYKKEVSRRSFSPVFVLTGSLEDTKILDDELSKWDKHKPGSSFKDWLSIYRFVPKDVDDHLDVIEDMKDMLERKLGILKGKERERAEELLKYLDPEPYGIEDLPAWVKDLFRDKDGKLGRFVTIFAGGNKSDAREVKSIVDELGTIKADHKVFHSAASFYILKDVLEILRKEGPMAVGLALLVVLLFLYMDLRSFRGLLFTSVPLLTGVLWMCGAMGLFGLKLNMFNIVVLPTILGIGVDNAVHMYHRYVQEGPGSAGLIFRTTGKAAFYASITTAAGFAGMLVATNRGLESIGELALIGIGTCLYTSVPLLAAVFQVLDSSGKKTSRGKGEKDGRK